VTIATGPCLTSAPPAPSAGGGSAPGRAVLDVALRRRGVAPGSAPARAPWDAAFFGLDRVTVFRRAPAATRRRVLEACAGDVLREALGVERLGLTFTARMTLLAETTEERMTYSLFAADEARHLAAVHRHRPDVDLDALPADPFLDLLGAAVAGGPRRGLAFLVQVVLEGWGLVHYSRLARACHDPALRRTLGGILADEALHHGAGRAGLRREALDARARAWAVEALAPLLALAGAGPQRVAARLTEAVGPLARAARVRLFAELESEAGAARTLALLRALMRPAPEVVAALDRRRAFVAPTPEQCAALGAAPEVCP
jgi:rubrerythrin